MRIPVRYPATARTFIFREGDPRSERAVPGGLRGPRAGAPRTSGSVPQGIGLRDTGSPCRSSRSPIATELVAYGRSAPTGGDITAGGLHELGFWNGAGSPARGAKIAPPRRKRRVELRQLAGVARRDRQRPLVGVLATSTTTAHVAGRSPMLCRELCARPEQRALRGGQGASG